MGSSHSQQRWATSIHVTVCMITFPPWMVEKNRKKYWQNLLIIKI